MKTLVFRIVFPLTIISFATLTKWWYTLPVDAPDTMFTGFPFPFACEGWHTSMSLQIFVIEFVADLLTYFLFWFIIIFCINRFVAKLKTHKAMTIVLWSLSGLIIAFATLLAANNDNIFYIKRPFKMDVMETGLQLGWQHIERPDFYKYHPETKRQ
jgi:membrane-associated phospholipid phosphatase